MVVDDPCSEVVLASALELPVDDVRAHLQALEEEYAAACRGFTLRNVAGGWRMYPGPTTRPSWRSSSSTASRPGSQGLAGDAGGHRLPTAGFEGAGQRSPRRQRRRRGPHPDVPWAHRRVEEVGESGAILYRTTPFFLQRMGFSSLDELPPLAPFLPDVDVIDELIEEGHA